MYEMRLYILNTTKPYRDNENDYAGAWFVCPVEFEEIKEKLGIEKEEDFEIEDYELPFTLNPDMPLWEINALCRMIQEIEDTPVGSEMQEIQAKWFQNIEDFIDNKDKIQHYAVSDSAALAEYLIMEEHCFGELPPELIEHIDFTSFGHKLEQSDKYLFTSSGVFHYE